MALSGIEISPDVASLYNEMKLRKVNKWAVFKIENKKQIVLDKTGEPCETTEKEQDKAQFENLREYLLGTKQPRYALYDFGFTMIDGRVIMKMCFIFCCFDNEHKIGDKMIYASSKDTIKKSFQGLGIEFQANDAADLDYDEFAKEVERKA